MAQEVVLIVGYPAGGKTTSVKSFDGYTRLNRDVESDNSSKIKSVADLLPRYEQELMMGNSVVMDNVFCTKQSRAKFISVARKNRIPIRCLWLNTTLEDAQFNACFRMMERVGRILDPKEASGDPNLFPVAVLYKYRKEFEPPSLEEGFSEVKVIPFKREYPSHWTNKALILDYDGTLRETKSGGKYPISPNDIRILPRRTETLKQYQDKGYLLLGVSNQSGIAKEELTIEQAKECFATTNEMLGLNIDVRFCPHKVPPITCMCRKPGCGLAVNLIYEYKLDPRQCIMVGDMGTDKSFAGRAGFQFIEANKFFNQ